MKKVFKFVKGKKDEKKEGGGITSSQSGDLIAFAQSPKGDKTSGLCNSNTYTLDFSGKDKAILKLHKAAWLGNLEKLKLALKKIEIDAVDKHNRSALHFAVAQGHPNIVWYLLGNNASVSICDDDGYTPLLKAIECDHKECLKLILERGADVNVADYRGNTGLHIAAKQGSLGTISMLLEQNANTEVSNNVGDFPLHIAVKCENIKLTEIIVKHKAEVNVLDRENRTPLMLSAKNGHVPLTEFLIKCGAQPTLVDSNGWSAEDYAMVGGHENIAFLLKKLINNERKTSSDVEDKNVGDEKLNETNNIKNETLNYNQLDVSETNNITTFKAEELMQGPSPDKSNNGEKEKREIIVDSPTSEVIPPYCEPLRSWDIIRAEIINDHNEETQSKRLSLATLGILQSRKEIFPEGYKTASPKHTLSLNRKKNVNVHKLFAKQRLSFHEETSINNRPTEDASTRSEMKGLEVENKTSLRQEVPNSFHSTLFKASDENAPNISGKSVLFENYNHKVELSSLGVWKRPEKDDDKTLHQFLNTRLEGKIRKMNVHTNPVFNELNIEKKFSNCELEESEIKKEANFPSPPSALELGSEMARSLKLMKGVSIDHTISTKGEKNSWKNSYYRQSIGCLEEDYAMKNLMLRYIEKNTRNPFASPQRLTSVEISRSQKLGDKLFETNRRINEQLECYDQALKELAETCNDEKVLKLNSEAVSTSHNYYSLPSSKVKDFNGSRKFNFEKLEYNKNCLTSGPFSAPTLVCSSAEGKRDDKNKGKEEIQISEFSKMQDGTIFEKNDQELKTSHNSMNVCSDDSEKKKKKLILLAMREVKPSSHIAATFKSSTDERILSPLSKSIECFDSENQPMNVEKTGLLDNFFFSSERQDAGQDQNDVDSQSNTSGTGEEPTLWSQDNLRKEKHSENLAELVQERFYKRAPSFSPLGVIYQEIQKENQKFTNGIHFSESESKSLTKNSERLTNPLEGESKQDLSNFCGNFIADFIGESGKLKEFDNQSPDVSLSSGPIEPLGTEKDSGSEPESSHNEISPTHHFSLKSHQEWLKSHLKSATSEKNKLEEIAAQLLEKAERLQYELADAKEATKSRDEVIKLLQEQLMRMEKAYTKSLEESVQSRLLLTTHEQEILHLKEICYKYEEEKFKDFMETDENSLEKMENKIKKLEGEKEKMKEEIVQLESEKTSLVIRLKELSNIETEINEQNQKWRERFRGGDGDFRGSNVDAIKIRSKKENFDDGVGQINEKTLKLEEITSECIGKNRSYNNVQLFCDQMKFDKKYMNEKKENNGREGQLYKKSPNMRVNIQSFAQEIQEKEFQVLINHLDWERKELLKAHERSLLKLNEKNSQLEYCKKENEFLKKTIESLENGMKVSPGLMQHTVKNDSSNNLNPCDPISKSIINEQNENRTVTNILKIQNSSLEGSLNENKISLAKGSQELDCFRKKDLEVKSENRRMKKIIFDLKRDINMLNHRLYLKRILSTELNIAGYPLVKTQLKNFNKKNFFVKFPNKFKNFHAAKTNSKFDETEDLNLGKGNAKKNETNTNADNDNKFKNLTLFNKIEFMKIKREICSLQNKMSKEKALRQELESHVKKHVVIDFNESDESEGKKHSLKRKVNRSYLQNELELIYYRQELKNKREKCMETENKILNDNYKTKCEILAKEKEKSKKIRSRIVSQASCFCANDREPCSMVQPLKYSSIPLAEPETFVNSHCGNLQCTSLEPEIKNQLDKELKNSIERHKMNA